MPFLRKAEEVELVHFDWSKAGVTFPRGQWVECEIDGLGNHIIVKVNGTTTASFRVDDSFYQRALGSRLPPGMTGKNAPFYEGMIGFQLPPEAAGKVELKDIQIKALGDINWVEGASAEQGSNRSNESWKASAAAFTRITDAEWSRKTQDLLKIAGREEGIPLDDETWRQIVEVVERYGLNISAPDQAK